MRQNSANIAFVSRLPSIICECWWIFDCFCQYNIACGLFLHTRTCQIEISSEHACISALYTFVVFIHMPVHLISQLFFPVTVIKLWVCVYVYEHLCIRVRVHGGGGGGVGAFVLSSCKQTLNPIYELRRQRQPEIGYGHCSHDAGPLMYWELQYLVQFHTPSSFENSVRLFGVLRFVAGRKRWSPDKKKKGKNTTTHTHNVFLISKW